MRLLFSEDREMIKIVFSSMMESQEMNHIEYKIFNSIQVCILQIQVYNFWLQKQPNKS